MAKKERKMSNMPNNFENNDLIIQKLFTFWIKEKKQRKKRKGLPLLSCKKL